MASRFWGGFAAGLLKERNDASDKQDEEDSFVRKQKLLKSLEMSDEKDFDKGKIVTRDGLGNVVRERPMTNDEIQAQRMDRQKDEATVQVAQARAAVDLKQASTFDEDRNIKLQAAADDRALRRASLANTQTNTQSMIQDRNDRALDRASQRDSELYGYGAKIVSDIEDTLKATPLAINPKGQERDLSNRDLIVHKAQDTVRRILAAPNGRTPAQKKADIDDALRPILSKLPASRARPALDGSTTSGITVLK